MQCTYVFCISGEQTAIILCTVLCYWCVIS